MKYTLYGNVNKPAVVLVGTWDPILQNHYAIIDIANNYCIKNDYELLIVLLDPNPADLLLETINPIFDCLDTRIENLQKKCKGGICKLTMNKSDLEKGVDDFIEVLKTSFQIAELWLRPNQTMGRGPKSSRENMDKTCRSLGVEVKNIPVDQHLKMLTDDIKRHLILGQFKEATKLVGRYPMWQKNELEYIPIGWKTGYYNYHSTLFIPERDTLNDKDPEPLEVYTIGRGRTMFDWPNDDISSIIITNRID